MPNSRERLQAMLAELQDELSDLPELDITTRTRVQATLSDIRLALAQQPDRPPGEKAPADRRIDGEDDTTLDDEASTESLAERLNDATRGLESTHPDLATTLGGVINALAQMGI